MSDIHFEYRTYEEINAILSRSFSSSFDVLVLAGDIAPGWMRRKMLEMIAEKLHLDQALVYVPGNHDYYGKQSDRVSFGQWDPPSADESDNYVTLIRDSLDYEGAIISGFVGWPYASFEDPPSEKALNDYRKREAILDMEYAHKVHAEQPDIVITHFLPHFRSIARKYAGEDNSGFLSRYLSPLVEAGFARYWFHGHTHTPCDYTIEGTRVVCAPVGYPNEAPGSLAISFGKTVKL